MKEEKRKQFIAIMQTMVKGDIGLVQGARILLPYINEKELENDEDALWLIGFESETDIYPLGDVRKRWSKEALAREDASMADYIERAGEAVIESCQALIAKYS